MTDQVIVCHYCGDDLWPSIADYRITVEYALNLLDVDDYCYMCDADYTDDVGAFAITKEQLKEVIETNVKSPI